VPCDVSRSLVGLDFRHRLTYAQGLTGFSLEPFFLSRLAEMGERSIIWEDLGSFA